MLLRAGVDRAALRFVGVVTGLVAACVVQPERPGAPPPDDEQVVVVDPGTSGLPDDGDIVPQRQCRLPNAGCPCDPATDTVAECHSDSPVEDEHGRLRCLVGDRACEDGVWGACVYGGSYAVDRPEPRAFGDAPGPCGFCDPSCYQITDSYAADPGSLAGRGSGIGWSAGPPAGIVMAAAGSALIGQNAWIAFHNSSEVAKVRASDGNQIGRFFVGDPGTTAWPSRTAVDTDANAYIASRAIVWDWYGFDGTGGWGAVTKIAGDPLLCRNAPTPNTSTTDVSLPRGTDDCVLWTVRIGSAQGSHVRGLAIDRDEYPWVGATNNVDGGREPGRAYQLDPVTGLVVFNTTLPIHPYGAVADGQDPQHIWFSSIHTGGLVSVDVTNGDLEGPFYPPTPNCEDGDVHGAYGITVDGFGRIWRAAAWGCSDYATRYDPEAGDWCQVRLPSEATGIAVRVNADGSNTVYAGRKDAHRFYRWDAGRSCVRTRVDNDYCNDWPDSPLMSRFVRDSACDGDINTRQNIDIYPAANVQEVHLHACPGFGDGDCQRSFYGVGIDADNRVWFVGNGSEEPPGIVVYDPDAGTWLPYPTTGAFSDPYTYSDFTGYQRSAFTLRGTSEYFREYGVLTPACPPATVPVWGDLNWTATTVNSQINFYAQVSTDPATLPAAPRIFLGSTDDPAPLYVNDEIPVNLRNARYVRIVAELLSLDGVTSAVLSDLSLDWQCYESE